MFALSEIQIIILFSSVGLLTFLCIYFLNKVKLLRKDFYKLSIETERLTKKNNKLTDLIDELSQSNTFFIKLFNDHPAIMVFADIETYKIVNINQAAINFYGYQKSELLKKTIFDLSALSKDEVCTIIENSINDNQYFYECKHKLADGTIKDIEVLAAPIKNIDGNETFFLIINDITKRKKSEDELKMLYKAVYHSSSTVVVTDTKGRIEFVNPKFEETTGYTRSEAIGCTPSLVKSGLNPKGYAKALWQSISAGKEWHNELINKRKDGTLYWEKVSISPVKNDKGEIINYIKVAEEITDKKKAEKKLKDREELYRLLTESTNDIIYKVSFIPEPHFDYISPSIEKVLGFSVMKYYEDIYFSFSTVHPDDREQVFNTLRDYTHKDFSNVTHRSITKSGNVLWLQFRNTLIHDVDGSIIGYTGIGRDITKEKESELALIKSEQKLKLALDSINYYQWDIDLISKSVNLSPSISSMFGFHIDEFPTKFDEILELIHPEDRVRIKTEMEPFLEGDTIHYNTEYRFLKKDGSYLWVHSSAKIGEYDKNGKPIKLIGITGDISKRKKDEEILKESENELRELNATKDKFFSIIAHDMKNPFNTLLNSAALLKDNYYDYPAVDKLDRILDIYESSLHLYKLLENLLQWSRSQTGRLSHDPDEFDLYEAAFNTTYLLKNAALKKDIQLSTDIKPETYVYADYNMLNTILRNLVSNAIKFTNSNGKVTISAEDKEKFVEISVKDTGIGISQENIKKLFRIDISYTTKGTYDETGTGLGLILCKEFIEKNGGTLKVDTIENVGSNFSFTIPKP